MIETIHHGARWCTRLQDACSLASIPYHRLSGDQSSALKRGHHRQMQMSKYRRTTTLVTTPPPEHCLSDTSEGFHHHHQQTQMNNEVIAKRNDTIPRIPVCTRPMFFCSHTGLGSENRSASRSKPDLDRSEYCAASTTCIRPSLLCMPWHAMHVTTF